MWQILEWIMGQRYPHGVKIRERDGFPKEHQGTIAKKKEDVDIQAGQNKEPFYWKKFISFTLTFFREMNIPPSKSFKTENNIWECLLLYIWLYISVHLISNHFISWCVNCESALFNRKITWDTNTSHLYNFTFSSSCF